MELTFPNYFEQNNKFKSLFIKENQFVNYVHNLDSITNVELSINQTFLLFVFEGEVKLLSSSNSQYLGKGEAVVIRKGAYIMSETLSKQDKSFKAFLFFLTDRLINDFCFDLKLKSENKVIQKSLIPVKISNSLLNYIDSIVLLLNKDRTATIDQLVQLKAKELLYLLYAANMSDELRGIFTQNNNSEKFQIQKTLEINLSEKLTIKQFAFLCVMSESNFKRRFKKLYGMSPGKWIKEKRLGLAKKLLLSTKNKIETISSDVGFYSTSHFSMAFKNLYGVSPSEFRVQN